MNKTLVSIEQIIDDYPAIEPPIESKGLMFRLKRSWLKGVSKEIEKYFHQQILALLKGLEGELPKEKDDSKLQVVILEHWIKTFSTRYPKEVTIRADDENYVLGYNSALEEVKTILEKYKKEIKK